MGIRLFSILVLSIFAQSANANSIEFVSTERVYTPTPFIPSMMTFSFKYMFENNLSELNRFEFFSSYAKYGRLFTVDKHSLLDFQQKNKECKRVENRKLNGKELADCGRFLAEKYVSSHNVLPQDFGFKVLSKEIIPKLENDVFFFFDGELRVLLHQGKSFDLKENKRYKAELNLSPYGDYDLREVDLLFDYEAYIQNILPL